MTDARKSNGNAYRKARAWLRDQGLPCALCGRAIDYSLPARHPLSFELDHVVPISRYWERAYNEQQHTWAGAYESAEAAAYARENMQATHRECNQQKSNKINFEHVEQKIFHSRQW